MFPQSQLRAEERAEAGANLRNWTFTSSRTAGADRNDRGERLDERDPSTNAAPQTMEGPDHGIGTMALCFRGQPINQQTAQQPTRGRYQHDGPEMGWQLQRVSADFVGGRGWIVALQVTQHEVLNEFQHPEEPGGS